MQLQFRKATEADILLYFEWTNDELTRQNSFSSELISFETHKNWFINKINSKNNSFYLFLDEEQKCVGQVRIEILDTETVIGISVDKNFRGLGLASEMIRAATTDFKFLHKSDIIAYIKPENRASISSFLKVGFEKVISKNNKYLLKS